eukprot:3407714-Rhodomonas_salina.3
MARNHPDNSAVDSQAVEPEERVHGQRRGAEVTYRQLLQASKTPKRFFCQRNTQAVLGSLTVLCPCLWKYQSQHLEQREVLEGSIRNVAKTTRELQNFECGQLLERLAAERIEVRKSFKLQHVNMVQALERG